MQKEAIKEYGCLVMEEAVKRPGGLGVPKNWYQFVVGATIKHHDGTTPQLMAFLQNVLRGTFDGLHQLERVEVYAEYLAHLLATTPDQRALRQQGVNVQWVQKKHVLQGVLVTIPPESTIEAVTFPNGRTVLSTYLQGDAHYPLVTSDEAKPYLGQTGTIIDVSFQRRVIQMTDGSMIILLVSERKEPPFFPPGA